MTEEPREKSKFELIKEKYKISYGEMEAVIKRDWTKSTSAPNLNRIFLGKVGCEIITLRKIIYAFNYILKDRGFDERVTPNDVVEYEDILCKELIG